MKLTKEKLQQIIKEELESLVSEEAFPEDKYKDFKRLKNRARLAKSIRDTIGDEDYKKLFDLKQKENALENEIGKDEIAPDASGDPQSKRFVERTKLLDLGMKLFKGKEDSSIARNMVNDFFDRDQPNLTQLSAMEDKIKALSGEFEERGSTDDQDRRYGRTSTTVTHKPTKTSKKVLSKQGSLGT